MRRRLLGAANKKLVRLHTVATQVKDLGGRDALAGAAAQELGRAKDKDYVTKLGSFSSGRLIDMLQAARTRNKRAGASAGGAAPANAPAKPKRAAKPAADKATKAKAPAKPAAKPKAKKK